MTELLWIRAGGPAPENLLPCHESISTRLAPPTFLDDISPAGARVATDIILLDLPVPGWEPSAALARVRSVYPDTPVILRDPDMSTSDAIRLARLGAWQCLGPGTTAAELEGCLLDVIAEKHARTAGTVRAAARDPWERFMIGESRAMREVGHVVRLVADRRCTVLITGDTGTGKEVVARALHAAGQRSRLPMVAVNCGALPEHLLEAELFGHVKGAFTGAVSQRIGRFEQAHNSTLFLDEIGDMPVDLQVKLLRALQEREFQRLGSSQTVKVDVRVIAATNANLLERVRQGKFREDLYYRLNVVPIQVQPLRDRLDDIAPLARHFIEKICRLDDLAPKILGPDAIDRLITHSWPGNVRELENAVEMAIALCENREVLYASDFRLGQAAARKVIPMKAPLSAIPEAGLDFHAAVSAYERELIEQALARTGGNKTYAANLLGLKRTTLLAKLRQHEGQVHPARTA